VLITGLRVQLIARRLVLEALVLLGTASVGIGFSRSAFSAGDSSLLAVLSNYLEPGVVKIDLVCSGEWGPDPPARGLRLMNATHRDAAIVSSAVGLFVFR
jgi:hypothetical protein